MLRALCISILSISVESIYRRYFLTAKKNDIYNKHQTIFDWMLNDEQLFIITHIVLQFVRENFYKPLLIVRYAIRKIKHNTNMSHMFNPKMHASSDTMQWTQ